MDFKRACEITDDYSHNLTCLAQHLATSHDLTNNEYHVMVVCGRCEHDIFCYKNAQYIQTSINLLHNVEKEKEKVKVG